MSAQPILFRTSKIIAQDTMPEDLPELLQLWNDGRVMRWVGFPDGLGYDAARMAAWYERLRANPDRRHFVVRSPQVGFCGELYCAIDRPHRRASLDIKFRPEAQGGGRAADALMGLIAHLFRTEPELDAVWTEPREENLAARALYFRCGLRPAPRPAWLHPGPSYWERWKTSKESL